MRISVQKLIPGVLFIISLGACSTTHSLGTRTPPVPTRNNSVTSVSAVSSWTPQIKPGQWKYLIRDSSTVSINNDTVTRIEPIESTTIYTITLTDTSSSLVLTGHIDSLYIRTRLSNRTRSEVSETPDIHGFVSHQGHFTETVSTSPTTVCTGNTPSPISRISELLIPLPNHSLIVGDKWSDTSSVTICHGKIPLRQIAVREYELLDLSSCQHNAVKVRRVVTNTFAGSSAEGSNHLSASGSGTANSILCLRQNTGALLESTGQSELQLTVTTTRGVFPFIQKTITHIETQ